MKTADEMTGNGHKPAEQLAQSGLQLLPLIMNNIPQAVFWKDRNLVYLGCNRAFAEDTGFSSPEEVIGKTDFDMPWKEQADLYRADDRFVIDSGESKLNYEEPQTTPDGSIIWLSTSKIPVRENGQVVAVLGMYEDITVRKRAEQAIKESEEKFKAIADNTAVGLFIYQDGIIRYVGREAARLLGYNVSETIGHSIMDFIYPDERQHIAEIVRRRTARENVPDQYETRMLKKDGSALDVLMFGMMIEYEGKPATQGAFLDLTGRKQADEAVRESEDRFRRFTEATLEGLVFHEQGKIVDANPAAIAMFGYSNVTSLIGRNLLEFITPDSHELVLNQMQSESVQPYEIKGIRKDGSIFPLETSTRAYKTGKRTIRASSLRDITERKRAEQALRDSEARYSAVVTQAKDGVVIIQDNVLQFVNQAVADMLGYTTAEMEKTPIIGYLAPESRLMVAERVKARLAGQEVPSTYEAKMQRKDGTIIDAEFSAAAIEYRGKPADVGMIRDITERKKAEETVMESRARFQSLVETLSDWIWEVDPSGKYTYVSPKVKDLLGYEPDEILGKTPFDLMPPEEAQRVAGVFGPLLSARQPLLALENTNIHKDGHLLILETSGQPFFDTQGQFKGYRGTDRDITKRMQAEQALRDSEARYSAVVTQAKDGVVIIQDNVLQFVNQAVADMLGYTTAEMEKTPIIGYLAPESRLMVAERVKARLAGQEVPSTYEAKMLRKDGTVLEAEFSAAAIEYRGKPADVGMIRDITERIKSEQALRDSRQLLQAVMDNIPQSVFWKDSELTYLGCNKAFADDTGFSSPDEVIGKTDWDMPWKEQAELYRADDSQVMKTGTSKLNYEEPQTTPDGSTIWLRTSKVPMHDPEGNIYAVLGMYEDITEQKNLELQVQTAFERRGLQVQLSTQVSQSIAAATSLEDLYQRVVTQVKEQFGYYHAQLLRYDAAQNAVVLITGYGETGAKMLSAGHRLPMGEGLIGTAAASGETVLRPVLTNDPDWHPNPLLPETKGEIAVPIKLGDNILGVLDVQANVANALDADDQLLLEGLCGQIAIAIESTRLRQEMAERLEEINRLYRAMSHEGWQAYRQTSNALGGFMFDQSGLKPIKRVGASAEFSASLPLTIPGGEVIGTLAIADDPRSPISPEDQIFVQQVSEQVALALESARLFEQTQTALSEVARRASELETVARVSATTSTELDPDNLLQSVVDLTKERFNLYHAHVYLADEAWSTLLLAAGAGEIGKKMVAEEHAIALDTDKSLVARAARERQAVITNDVTNEPDFLPNPLLPRTRSEMAIPMIVGDKVLGVFDVQSDRQDGFTKEDANIYTTLASQVAVALQNARLYNEQTATVTQLRELDRLKTSFLANMSHELRTPLNSILGFSDVIIEGLDGPVTEQMDNDLRLIGKNGQHLLHLINDVLDMAKIDAGRMNLQPEKFKLNSLFEEVINITSPLASAKALPLVIKKDSNRKVEIFADRTRIQQVMINLINNAIKFTEKGEVTLCAKKKEDSVLIEVHDTGIGILPEQLQIIFQEFTQVDTSTTRKAGGTGLGLPISRRLIEMHGGRLWAESTGVSGEGSTFSVELPLIAKITEPVEVKER